MKITIYRIIQKHLSNAENHSDAYMVRLHMAFADEKKPVHCSSKTMARVLM